MAADSIRIPLERPYRLLVAAARRKFLMRQSKPALIGKVACHIVHLDAECTLADQIAFIVQLGVKTFRIYSVDVISANQSLGTIPGIAVEFIPIHDKYDVMPLVDAYNSGLPGECWSLLLYAGEYICYPYFETRKISDLCQFLTDERNLSLFAVTIDAYPINDSASANLKPGNSGWAVDRFGLVRTSNAKRKLERWRGGFAVRFGRSVRPNGLEHVSRIPLIRAKSGHFHSRDMAAAVPDKLNAPFSAFHVGLTGCIISDNVFRSWSRQLGRQEWDSAFRKLRSAPLVPIDWSSRQLLEHDFMNKGQWI
jgi:hypothetical protein